MSKSDCTRTSPLVKPTVFFSQLPNWIVRDPSIPPTMKTMALVLAGYAFGERPSCWPSTKTLAEAVGIDRGHARRVLRAMIARKLIARAPLNVPGERLKRQFVLLWKAGAEDCLKRALTPDPERARPPAKSEEVSKIENPATGDPAVKPPPPPKRPESGPARPSRPFATSPTAFSSRPRPTSPTSPTSRARSLEEILAGLGPNDPFFKFAMRSMESPTP